MNDRVLKIKRGDTLQLFCKLSDEIGEVKPLNASYEINMQIRRGVDKDLVWDFGQNGGITKLSELSDGNNLVISATAEQTATMPVGRYLADIEIIQNGETHTLPPAGEASIVIEIEGDITK